MMHVYNLNPSEIDIVWNSLDVDKSGTIDLKEFSRKLERYGVRNVSKEETIIIQMIQAVQRSPNVRSLSKLFEIIDKQGRGYISRQDFADIFYNLNLKIDQAELDRFLDHWWKDKEAGIDYKGFHRIFNKY
jgi:Ca2+-binding EF-hand superfamily protein